MAAKKVSKKTVKPDYMGSLADYKISVSNPRDNNDNRERQLRNNELAARIRSAQNYGVKSLDVRMAEAGYGTSGFLSRALSRLGGGLTNRGK